MISQIYTQAIFKSSTHVSFVVLIDKRRFGQTARVNWTKRMNLKHFLRQTRVLQADLLVFNTLRHLVFWIAHDKREVSCGLFGKETNGII